MRPNYCCVRFKHVHLEVVKVFVNLETTICIRNVELILHFQLCCVSTHCYTLTHDVGKEGVLANEGYTIKCVLMDFDKRNTFYSVRISTLCLMSNYCSN